jgi:hypothetical protein
MVNGIELPSVRCDGLQPVGDARQQHRLCREILNADGEPLPDCFQRSLNLVRPRVMFQVKQAIHNALRNLPAPDVPSKLEEAHPLRCQAK